MPDRTGRKERMIRTRYQIKTQKNIERSFTLSLVPDFHNCADTLEKVRKYFKEEVPDAILVCGDICSGHLTDEENEPAFEFLKLCASTAPSFYSLGNHEWQYGDADREKAESTGVILLDNRSCLLELRDGQTLKHVSVGGMTSSIKCGLRERYERIFHLTSDPDLAFVRDFDDSEDFKILMSHHPEDYRKYLSDTGIDLIVSGHAHGGQIRFGAFTDRENRVRSSGVYSPGQGLFPKTTGGITDGRLVTSRGLTNSTPAVPRWGNPPEIVYIDVIKEPCNG